MFKGWSNGERAYAVGLTFAVVLLGLCAMIYDGPQGEYKPYPNAAANGNAEQHSDLGIGLQIGDLIVQSIMAAGTLALFVLGWRSFVTANKATERSLQLTQESNETLIEAERGRLVIRSFDKMSASGEIDIQFMNVGRAPLNVVFLSLTPYVVIPAPKSGVKSMVAPPSFPPLVRCEHYMEGGGELRTRQYGKAMVITGKTITLTAEDVALIKGGDHSITVHFYMRYQTMGRTYIKQEAMHINPLDGTFATVASSALTYERRVRAQSKKKVDPTP